MKAQSKLRRLHMGCGERLVARLGRVQPACVPALLVVPRDNAPLVEGKDKR